MADGNQGAGQEGQIPPPPAGVADETNGQPDQPAGSYPVANLIAGENVSSKRPTVPPFASPRDTRPLGVPPPGPSFPPSFPPDPEYPRVPSIDPKDQAPASYTSNQNTTIIPAQTPPAPQPPKK